MGFFRHLFGKNFLKQLALEWLESYLQDQVEQLMEYLAARGWVDDGGLRVPPEKLPEFSRDLVRGIVHVVQHG